jgi:hypothetical protein
MTTTHETAPPPHHEVQALACLARAQFLHDNIRMIQVAEDRPKLAECYRGKPVEKSVDAALEKLIPEAKEPNRQ